VSRYAAAHSFAVLTMVSPLVPNYFLEKLQFIKLTKLK
jgi:hypothetical protein